MQKFHNIIEKISRMIYLIKKGKHTSQELAFKMSVSKRTIQNWIRYLKIEHNVEIYYDRSQNCYKCVNECGKLVLEFKKDEKKDDTKLT
jgi:predicted DNA-binding transcriptional regulator YafY